MTLDPHFTARGAPPGSMRWHALLYAAPRARDRVAAAFALEAELRELAGGTLDHGVAHRKLDWWLEEALRLSEGAPRHPLTVELLAGGEPPTRLAADLKRALGAAQIELAQAVLQDDAELDRYLDGAGRAIVNLALGPSAGEDAAQERFAAGCGSAIRLVEIVRDLRRDAWRGRVFLPWDWVEDAGLGLEALRSGAKEPGLVRLVGRAAALARSRWSEAQSAARGVNAELRRPLQVLGTLHLALLDRITGPGSTAVNEAEELPPLSRLFVAWRAARRN